MSAIQDIHNQLKALLDTPPEGFPARKLSLALLPGDTEVVQAVVEGLEELPIFLSVSDTQLLVMLYLWRDKEVKKKRRDAMLEVMIDMNIPMPLSAFGKIKDRFVLFGALSTQSPAATIAEEIFTLADNGVEALGAMAPFLK